MTSASKSLYVFAIYLLVLGVLLIVIPNSLLSMFQIPETNEVWIRIAGVLTFSIGIYYFYMAPPKQHGVYGTNRLCTCLHYYLVHRVRAHGLGICTVNLIWGN
jgi:hypothetical protein